MLQLSEVWTYSPSLLAVLMDETKRSYVWLFETWLAAMGGRQEVSLITDRDKAMEVAIMRVFPNTHHQQMILNRCKQKLADAYLKHAALKGELKRCVNESETVEDFESKWECMLARYNLWDNAWLQSLYDIRRRWANVYQKDTLFPELCGSQRPKYPLLLNLLLLYHL